MLSESLNLIGYFVLFNLFLVPNDAENVDPDDIKDDNRSRNRSVSTRINFFLCAVVFISEIIFAKLYGYTLMYIPCFNCIDTKLYSNLLSIFDLFLFCFKKKLKSSC